MVNSLQHIHLLGGHLVLLRVEESRHDDLDAFRRNAGVGCGGTVKVPRKRFSSQSATRLIRLPNGHYKYRVGHRSSSYFTRQEISSFATRYSYTVRRQSRTGTRTKFERAYASESRYL